MSQPPRNWDQELAKIDRLIAAEQGGAPAAPAPRHSPSAAPPGSRVVLPPARRSTRAAWLATVLAVVLGAGMTQWPWAHACGAALLAYLAAASLVLVTGAWAAVVSWHRRAGLAHVLALLTLLWGGLLVVLEVLPRIGYAASALAWRCG